MESAAGVVQDDADGKVTLAEVKLAFQLIDPNKPTTVRNPPPSHAATPAQRLECLLGEMQCKLSGLCLCKGEAKIGPGRPSPILN